MWTGPWLRPFSTMETIVDFTSSSKFLVRHGLPYVASITRMSDWIMGVFVIRKSLV